MPELLPAVEYVARNQSLFRREYLWKFLRETFAHPDDLCPIRSP